jgi:hypothetical protein
VDIALLNKLVPLLNKNRVDYFKSNELEIRFVSKKKKLKVKKPKPKLNQKGLLVPQGTDSFRGDDLMSADQILNWSASPAPEAAPVALTGDQTLTETG